MTGQSPAEIFDLEARELLDQLEQVLLDLESDSSNSSLIDSAFRALHTIKGSGAMFGFEAVASFTHHVETAFDRVRQGRLAAGPELIALALAANDHIRHLTEAPGIEDEAAAAPILQGLKALVEGSEPASTPPTEATRTWRIHMRLPTDAMVTGTNPLLLLDELRTLGSAVIVAETEDVPELERLVTTECHVTWSILLSTSQPKSAIEEIFLFVIDDMELRIEAEESAVAPSLAVASQPAPVEAPAAQPSGSMRPAAEAGERRPVRPEKKVDNALNSVRIPAQRLDDLMDRVGELVIAQSRLSQVANASNDPQVKSIAEEIQSLTLELRDSTMGVRMVPIGELFGRFRRLVHDLGHELGKKIELVTVGDDTELDKTLIERLNDPLVHLLRNAIDHGLEPIEGRDAAGKTRCGRITLTARHAGAEVLISIADDGRGLDRHRILARAQQLDLLPAGANPSDSELFRVIFEPGFSTAEKLTKLSGRGVGMDVVKRAIEGLRGKIDISSTPGLGTELTLRLPLTLAIIDGLLVRVGTGRYVLPLSTVEECVELSAEQDTRSRGCNFLNIRGDLVPFLRLRELFAISTPTDAYQKVVLVSFGKLRIGLVVDQVIGNHQTVIKSLSKLHAHVQTFSGATILGDGAVALILDVAHLVAFGQAREERLRPTG